MSAALLVGWVAWLVLDGYGVPSRIAAACYRWAATIGRDATVLAPEEVGRPVLALRCLRSIQIGISLLIYSLVCLGAAMWWLT